MKRWLYYYPVLLIVGSNIIYDISAKSFPGKINPQAGLTAVYAVAAGITFIIYMLTSANKNYLKEIKKVNWAAFLLAAGCMGIDLGYILLFRAGWNISIGSLVCNIAIALSLILVGVLFYKEKITKDHLIGIALCMTGLILINS
jgi:drug/metabolite transporter (DMT)-like permease